MSAICKITLSQSVIETDQLNSNFDFFTAQCFTENKGQIATLGGNIHSEVDFVIPGNNANVYVNSGGIIYNFLQLNNTTGSVVCKVMRMELIGCNARAQPFAIDTNLYYENYYSNSSKNPITIHSFNKIIYPNVYPHIDWILYFNEGDLKYDFILHPGANIQDIKIKYEGHDSITVNKNGDIEVKNVFGIISEKAPVAYIADNINDKFACSFNLKENVISFNAAEYDKTKTLILDPILQWSTYFGGLLTESGYGPAIDSEGNVYICGSTSSAVNIAYAGFDTIYNLNGDAFLTKYNSNGTRLWSTYYGGSASDGFNGIVVDSANTLFCVGTTSSTSGIAFMGYSNTLSGSSDIMIVNFNADGTLNWGTYFGGPGTDAANGICLDKYGDLYFTGTTTSTTGIAFNGYDMLYGGGPTPTSDAFLTKFSNEGELLWSTYYGGSGAETGNNVTCDKYANVYLVGSTTTTSGLGFGLAYDYSHNGGQDAYVAKYDLGGILQMSTYYGGASDDYAYDCAVDTAENIFFYGISASSSGIAYAGYDMFKSDPSEGFVVKLNKNGVRQWGTYNGYNSGKLRCTLDAEQNLYAGCSTYSSGMATNGFDLTFGGVNDVYITKISSAGTKLWSSYFGGSNDDGISDILFNNGNIYVAGSTQSSDGINTSGFQPTIGGGYDAFLFKCNDFYISFTGLTYTFCQGAELSLNYDASAFVEFSPGNILKMELSNSAGTFVGTYIGTLTTTNTSGVITGIIPATSLPGSNYKVRIVSTLPVMTGISNPGPFTIVNAPDAVISPAGISKICEGNSVTLSRTGAGAYTSIYWSFNGVPIPGATAATYSANSAGNYTVTVADAVCSLKSPDKIVQIVDYNLEETVKICTGDFYTLPNGTNVNIAGDYISNLLTVTGCDSTITTHLSLLPVFSGFSNIEICSGETYTLPNGEIVSESGDYLTTLQSPTICTEITTHLSIIEIDTTFVFDTIIEGESYSLPDGLIVLDEGTYISSLIGVSGCDSVIKTLLTVNNICNPPVSSSISNITTNSVKVSWPAVPGATKYQIYYRPSGTIPWLKLNSTTNSKKIVGLLSGTGYDYKIKTICPLLSSGFTPISTFTTNPLREANLDSSTTINIQPNPNNGVFIITYKQAINYDTEVNIILFNSYGAIVYQNKFNNINGSADFKIDCTLPDGAYILSINDNKTSFNKNLIIIK